MAVIGITGGICTGKSSFVESLRTLLPEGTFFDADEMARKLTRSDPGVLGEIRAQFGADVFSEIGELNRAALRAIVFGAPEKRRVLENILHPRIRRHWAGEAEKHRHSLFFADIPLLYETGGEMLCDAVAVVACSEGTQLARLMSRRGLDRGEAEAIIAAQMPLPEKVKRADHVIWNNGPRAVLTRQAELLARLWKTQ